ncbi:DUF2771 domain-containing protein [Mycobacterium vicinigordonae]|uniref:DUF2771 domain-containing protein n=1 Tax=Mycobacterium vicinigordonae TaxID=1719132 RepID=A0A7D6HZY0_9MYCO|nr:DUF2771 domain-containing protein [Mycobacterium vicinigordonae]QLL06714.1 DUF2771 domain-containing protein [Mycobacterium vicinigordonae]
MKPRVVALLVSVVVLAAGAGVGTWLLLRDRGPSYPVISAYSNGHLTRVGPYMYCNVLNLNDCQEPRTQGELPVSERYPVQLSVPEAIGRAPWKLLQTYEDPTKDTTTIFRPNSTLAVTIPTVDPQRGRLTGVVVQLLTKLIYNGEELFPPHAEWSVRVTF